MKRQIKITLYFAVAVFITWHFLPEKYSVNPAIKFISANDEPLTLEHLTLAEGFNITVYASKLAGARTVINTGTGELIVSQPSKGIITQLHKDTDDDGRADGQHVLIKDLNKPYGLALHKGWLYVAETDAIFRIRYDAEEGETRGKAVYIVQNRFAGGGNHWSRSIKISPDNKLFVSIGSSCNVCIEESEKRASILQYDLDGTNEVLYASGLRNTVGFDWQTDTLQLYGVDNGRDFLGDNSPPEELNRIQQRQHYGWPYLHANNIADPQYTAQKPSTLVTTTPEYLLPAHSAPLSLLFIKHNSKLKGQALVSLHGSWNRSKKAGYKVIIINFSPNKQITQTDFITGFENNEAVFGRPVDLTEDKNGNIYLSDDFNGRIYKISAKTKH